MDKSTEKPRSTGLRYVPMVLGWSILMALAAAIVLIILVSYRLEVRTNGYTMMDLWGSGTIRAIPAGADRLVRKGNQVLGLGELMLAACLPGSTLALVLALKSRRKVAAILAIIALLTSVVGGLVYMQTSFILAGI